MTRPETFSFEVLPQDMDGGPFEAFVLDVPTLGGRDAAARRAYFSAMSYLRDVAEPEDFIVRTYPGGQIVTAAGIAGCS